MLNIHCTATTAITAAITATAVGSNWGNSDMGAARLADWLLHPAGVSDILARQSAVKELSKKI